MDLELSLEFITLDVGSEASWQSHRNEAAPTSFLIVVKRLGNIWNFENNILPLHVNLKTTMNMKHKSGDKVKVINPAFAKAWENMGRKNEWVIDFIETQSEGYPSLYICYCVDDSRKMLFHFLEEEVEIIKQ